MIAELIYKKDALHAVLHNEGQAAVAAVENIKAVDAVPAVHGEWLRTGAFPHRVYCSNCYKTYVPNDRWQIWIDGDLPRDYCPNCGAKMDGERKDGERDERTY